MKAHLLPLHERYPKQPVRVVRQGRASTISVEWDEWLELLQLVPKCDAVRLALLVREEVVRLEAGGRVKGLSKQAARAVRARLTLAVQ